MNEKNLSPKVLTPEEHAIHARAKKDGITRASAAECIRNEKMQADAAKAAKVAKADAKEAAKEAAEAAQAETKEGDGE